MYEESHVPEETLMKDKLSKALKEKEVFAKALVEFNQSFDKKVRELSILRRVSDGLLSSFDLKEILIHTLDIISEEIPLVNCSIMLLDNEGKNLQSRAAKGINDEAATFFDDPYGLRQIPVGRGVAGTAVKTLSAILCQDTTNDARFTELPGAVEIGSLLCLPLISKGRALGVLNLSDAKPLAFSPEDERVMVIVAGQLAIAVENARLIERLLDNERLSTLGKMAATIIHDMKSPLQVISGYAEMLADGNLGPEERKYFFDVITKQVDRFVALAQETLEFSRGVESNPARSSINLSDFAKEVETSLKPEFDKLGIEIETNTPDTGTMNADMKKMLRVMFNLASNARDAMPRGGTLSLNYFRLGDGVKIEVEDTGKGIPPKIRARLFEPFVTDGKAKGTGLGLAIVKKIVESHDGWVKTEEPELGGARFVLFIPDE